MFQQQQQQLAEKQQQAPLKPAHPPLNSQNVPSQPSGVTPQDKKRLQSPSEPTEDPEGELKVDRKGRSQGQRKEGGWFSFSRFVRRQTLGQRSLNDKSILNSAAM